MVFQFASTNLVFELGIVIWIFLGWQFTLAELVGGLLLIVLMWIGVRVFVSRREEEAARVRAQAADAGHQHHSAGGSPALSLEGWSDVAHNFRGDWQMLWKEIGAGFLIAGFVALLPKSFFNSLFLTGHGGALQVIENVLVGPLVAVLSFVCSVGNVPLAAVLWGGGISFAGVIAFIYADLIIIPLVLRLPALLRLARGGDRRRADVRRDGRRRARRGRDLQRARARALDAAVDRLDRRARRDVELHGRAEHPLHAGRGRRCSRSRCGAARATRSAG